MPGVWRIEMLGTLQAVGAEITVSRFRTRRVGLLLAHLALFRDRLHFRDEVGELLWPDHDPEVARRNLRQALSSLRHAIEPPTLPAGSVLQVHQSRLRLNPDLVSTDVAEFESTVSAARHTEKPDEQYDLLYRAVALYRGELLPGFDEPWLNQERLRIEDLYVYSLRRLAACSQACGRLEEAAHFLRLGLARDNLSEEWHVELMRHYLATDRPEAAVRQYAELESELRNQVGDSPSHEALSLLEEAQDALQQLPRLVTPNRRILVGPPAVLQPEEPSRVVRLPITITRFCGREEEVDYALEHVLARGARLTTLIGPAGTGKTRLSIEVARKIAESGSRNVWFVPLADLDRGDLIYDAVLDVLRARRSNQRDALEQIAEALRGSKRNLIVLDNLEHIVDAAVPLIHAFMIRIPEAQLLVTSRHLLRIEGEHQIAVPPLPIPFGQRAGEPSDRAELASIAGYPSVQLFVDRCQSVRPDFQLTSQNASAVVAICSKLEGIPLAIELAAGLSGAFAPSQMVVHLQKHLSTLMTRRRDMPARHRSLRAAIDYSYDTLPVNLQQFFAALSVFRGGFGVEAAYEVCYRGQASVAPDPTRRRSVTAGCLDWILELQERSLVRSETEDTAELRFRLLESFREYGEERLDEENHLELRRKHAEYLRQRPAPLPRAASTEERTARHLWIQSEFDNYVAALEFYFQQSELEACIDLLETLASTWTNRGPRAVERAFIRKIADRSSTHEIEPSARILVLRMLGTTYIRSSEYAAAYAACREALRVATEHGFRDQVAVCELGLATCAGFLGRLDECRALSEKVLREVPHQNLPLRERALTGIGAVHWGQGEFKASEAAFRQAAEISSAQRAGEPETLILYNLARLCMDQDRLDQAMTILARAMRNCQRVNDEFGLALCLSLVSRYHWLRGQLPAALATGHEALLKHRETDFHLWNLLGLFQQALILTDAQQWEAATVLLGATQGIGLESRLPDLRDQEAATQSIERNLSPAEFQRAWARGLAMDIDAAFRLALQSR